MCRLVVCSLLFKLFLQEARNVTDRVDFLWSNIMESCTVFRINIVDATEHTMRVKIFWKVEIFEVSLRTTQYQLANSVTEFGGN